MIWVQPGTVYDFVGAQTFGPIQKMPNDHKLEMPSRPLEPIFCEFGGSEFPRLGLKLSISLSGTLLTS